VVFIFLFGNLPTTKVSQKRNTVYFVFYARNAVKRRAVHANPYGGGSGNRVYNIIHYMAAVRVRGRRRKRPVRVIFNLRPRILNAKI